MPNRSIFLALVLLTILGNGLFGQRIRPQFSAPQGINPAVETQRGLVPAPPVSTTSDYRSTPPFRNTQPVILQQPTFDPYATSPNAASSPPSLLGTPAPQGTVGPSPYAPQGTVGPSPNYQSPSRTLTPGVPSGLPATGSLPPTAYPQQPPVLFPNGLNVPYATPGWPTPQPGPYLRLFQDLRFRYTWLAGDNSPTEMDINAIDLATTVNFPNFLYTGAPLQVSPVFVFDFWSGPGLPAPFALPSRAYSAFLNFGWEPTLTPMLGGDIDVGVGVFSDFKTVRSEAVRYFGTGVLVLNLTPTVTVKAGVNYLDRVDLKLLPAGGILWTPNPQTRFDIFFPRPKLAQYLTTIGNTDVWWYLNGEYGGSSWAIDRIETDINDIRVGGGLEWTRFSGVRGFVEAAYVFNREIIYNSPTPDLKLDDTIMLRGGLAY